MDSRKYSSSSDRHLIAEQPGMMILMLGFAVAFLLGYTIKSITSPARVAAQIEKAASHIHKDVRVQFDSAQFSLSDGILPQVAIIISNVRMESEQVCWGSPILEVDELRLPVSLWSAFKGQGAIRDIHANIVNLRLRNDPQNCDEQELQKQKDDRKNAPLVSLTPLEQTKKYQNDVRSLYFQKFTLQADKHPQFQPELLNFAVKVKSYEPRVIEITAKSHLLRDIAVGDYLSHANLFIQYKESPEKSVNVHFFGNWREGHYSVIGNYTIDENILALETDLKHIPLSQILAMLQKYNLVSKDLNGRQVWMSSKARVISPVDKLRQTPLEVRDLRLEGDLGELRVDAISLNSLEPLSYQPIQVDVKKLDVEKLLFLLNRPSKTNMLANLGEFTGRAEIISEKQMRLSGQHSGLQFVFSNKGQQELQVIDSMVGDVLLKDNTWNFNIRRVEPRGGIFIGSVNMKADRDFKDVEIKTRIDEVSLDPAVQKLMTNGGNIGNMTFESDLRLKQGEIKFLKGMARIDAMNVEGVGFGKTKASFDWKDNEIRLHPQMSSLDIALSSPAAGVLKTVTYPEWWNAGSLKLSALEADFRVRSFQDMSWHKFQAHIGKNGKLTTEGSWNTSGELQGQVISHEGKDQKKWQISGTRENPQFSETSTSPNPMRK